VVQGEKTGFLRHLYIKVIFLPRQARDKHRKNSKKDGVLSQVPGEGIIGPFHRALDRNSLWRPMAVSSKKGVGEQGMLRPVACATSEPVLSSPPIEA
jgi:hypothetical protein